MNNNPQTSSNDQEIDLGQLSKKIGQAFQSFIDRMFEGILFLLKNKVIIGLLVVIGFGLGIFLDKTSKNYDHKIIVSPNFGSTDYLYSKVNLINAKIKEGDTLFLKGIGIKESKKFNQIEIEPIIDVYRFIEGNEKNFDMLKLMAEDGDLKKIVEENITSKNYRFHTISFATSNATTEQKTLQPLLDYFNDSEYYKKIQTEYINNVQIKIKENDSIIKQIDGLLNQFSNTVSNSHNNDKLVYYNENTQLNEIIKTKEALIKEQGNNRIELINADKIVKESSHILNLENRKALNGRKKLILPLFFVGLFVLYTLIRSFYNRQMAKRNLV